MSDEIIESTYPRLETGIFESNLIKPRTASDPFASFEAFSARGRLFKSLEKSITPKLERPKLVSSIRGGVGEILLTIPPSPFFSNRFEGQTKIIAEKYAAAFRAIISESPKTTSFVILVNKVAEEKINEWANELNVLDRINIVIAPDDINFTVWAEDAYCICNDGVDGERFFVEPASFNRADDAIIADIVASKSKLSQTQVPLYFQGGNVLIGDDFWMIGADYPNNSLNLGYVKPEVGETELEAVERVYSKYLDSDRTMHIIGSRIPVPTTQVSRTLIDGEVWDEVHYFGNNNGTLQPLFHIDMFISFMGRGDDGSFHLTVADPRMAAELLGQNIWPWAMPAVFDDIAAQLKQLGFTVHRNPMPLAYDDDATNKTRIWYFATSNNVIVQDSPKKVWIPTYGHKPWEALAVTDQTNKEIWESQGFEVAQLPDFHPFAANLGAAHCISKYISRNARLIS